MTRALIMAADIGFMEVAAMLVELLNAAAVPRAAAPRRCEAVPAACWAVSYFVAALA